MVIGSTFLKPEFLTYFKRMLTNINIHMLTNIRQNLQALSSCQKKQWKWDLKEIDKIY